MGVIIKSRRQYGGASSGGQTIQVDTLPTASSENLGVIYQFIGATDANYTNGFFYHCVENSGVYSWEPCEVQDGTESLVLSQSDYDNLTDEEKNNGTVYYVNDAPSFNLDNAAVGNTPIGTIISVMGTSAPKNFLVCNGQILNIATYPQLAHYFKTQFGSENYFGGDGTITFAVPDLRGEFLRGTGTNSHTNQGSGGEVGEHQDATDHPRIDLSNTNNEMHVPYVGNGINGVYNPDTWKNYYTADTSYTNVKMTRFTGWKMDDHYTSRPTNTSVLYCIAYKNIYVDVKQDYSYEEKEIGYWVDGRPIYQKTVECSAIGNNTTTTTQLGISDLDVVVDFSVLMYNAGKTSFIKLPNPAATNSPYSVDCDIENGLLRIITHNGTYTTFKAHATVQYTKTTD